MKEIEMQRFFEVAYAITDVISAERYLQTSEKILWTPPPSSVELSPRIADRFQYLNSWILHLIQRTSKRLIFIAPYYSVAGMEHLSVSLKALFETRQDVRVDWIVGECSNSENERAFEYLKRVFGSTEQIRIFHPVDPDEKGLVFHAKVLLSDEEKGYLGSANFSRRGLQHQFELGISLTKDQSVSLTMLVDYWISTSHIREYTAIV
ncbi:phospholipase D-like domain-containing protein [Cohnella hongkongensis]|uniref:Phospholipase D-like domain-containing protein n=1 Tax=Cohnella hongkongensis TaxID=178337 RepID=A0ABV9FIM1_9BACL